MDAIDSRPLTFTEVVGQTAAKNLLSNSIKTGSISRAYLLPGPYGVGKTTLATLFSRSLLCSDRDPITGSPCNKCQSCKDFLRGAHASYTEIDAANHGGKDDIAELLQALNYDFGTGYRVILIDEAHSISKAGKDALLRVFERPITDDNTVFILCTTEMDKMPKTLRSRCLIVPMRKPTASDVFLKLKTVCDSNDIRYDRGALVSLAEWSDGHFRDAENAVTPLIMMGGINSENVAQYTCHDPDATASLLVAMESNLPNALGICDDLCSKFGADTIHTSIIRILVEAISYGLTGMSSEIPDSYKKVYQAMGSRMGNVLNHFISKARITDSRFMQAEVIQVYYKFLKGDMDLATGMTLSSTAAPLTFAKENAGKGSSGTNYLQEQLALKASSRRSSPKAEDAGPSLFGPEEVPQTNIISRN